MITQCTPTGNISSRQDPNTKIKLGVIVPVSVRFCFSMCIACCYLQPLFEEALNRGGMITPCTPSGDTSPDEALIRSQHGVYIAGQSVMSCFRCVLRIAYCFLQASLIVYWGIFLQYVTYVGLMV